jgi:hypothetical protein
MPLARKVDASTDEPTCGTAENTCPGSELDFKGLCLAARIAEQSHWLDGKATFLADWASLLQSRDRQYRIPKANCIVMTEGEEL